MAGMTMKLTAILMALSIGAGGFTTEAQALGRKERNIAVGIVIGAAATKLIQNGREIRQTRARNHLASSTVNAAIHNVDYSFNSMSHGQRLSLQRNLRAAGYYGGGIDGAWGVGMRNAFLRMFQDKPAAARISADRNAVHGLMFDLARG